MEYKCIGGHTFDETLLGDGCVLDIGCRGFEFSKYFTDKNIKTYRIDPDEKVFEFAPYLHNLKFDMVLAIASVAGETTYYPNGEATMIREVDPDPTYPHIDQKYSKTCKTITMDDLYKITGENVDILKLDCEGGEYIILGETFKPIPKQITVEFHHHCVPDLHKKLYPAIIERLSKDYSMHNDVWEQRHGCGFNFWDTLFIRKINECGRCGHEIDFNQTSRDCWYCKKH